MKTKIKSKTIIIAGILGASLVASSHAATLSVDTTTNNFATTASYTTVTVTNGGTLNLTGGALTLTTTSQSNNSGQFHLNNGSLLNFSGGVHTINERIQTVGATSIIRITGSAATINVHQQGGFNADMDFVFDAAGISTFDSDSRLGFGSSTITIDASAYTGGDATFVLVDTELFNATYANNGGGFGTIGTIIAPTGFTATLDQSLFDGDDDAGFTGEITLTITAVPEPSSTALLGLGGLALILRRRK
ncbi:MAG: PEP-CTERM sorting domain-containing protein [Akkermansiaceae bacterium]